MAAKITKYLFDTDFAPDMSRLRDQDGIAWDVPPTRADIDRARTEGFSAGRAEAEAETSRLQAQALNRFAEEFVTLKISHEKVLRASTGDAVALALTVGRKLAENLIATHPLGEIEALMTHCLSRLMGEARIVLRIHESLLDALRERVDKLTRRIGFEGHVILLGDESIAPGDCRIEWADGGAERDAAKLADDLENTINRMVQAGVADAVEIDPEPETGE